MATVPSVSTVNVGDDITDTYLNSIKTYLDWLENLPRCQVYDATGTSCTHNTATLMTYDTEIYDTDTMHSTSSNTSRVTFTTAGLYLVTCYVSWNNVAASTYNGGTINPRLNSAGSSSGGTSIRTHRVGGDTQANQDFPIRFTFERSFSAGDYIEIFVLQTNSSSAARTSQTGNNVTGVTARRVAAS